MQLHLCSLFLRCPKQTNIAIGESFSDENEGEAVTTSVDAGALDSAVDELVSKNSGCDSTTPQSDPDSGANGGQNLQMQLPGKVLDNISPQTQSETRTASPQAFEGMFQGGGHQVCQIVRRLVFEKMTYLTTHHILNYVKRVKIDI